MIARMDQGHGLVDRILLAIPLAFRPTLSEMETVNDHLATEVVSDFQGLFQNINDIEENTEFAFDEEGRLLLREKMDHFVACRGELSDYRGKSAAQIKDARAHPANCVRPPRLQSLNCNRLI